MIDIHTQSNLAEVEIVSLVQELIPRYRLRAETDFACSNEDFIQTPRIDGSEFESLTNPQIRALLDYYASSSNRISQMTKTYHDISAVTRMLEDRENDLQMAVSLGHTLLESNDTLRNQVSLLEKDIEQTTEIVKQVKHDLLLKERLLRFYTDMDLDATPSESNQFDGHHYEQKIRNLEYENQELRAESMQLKLETENYEHQEQAIVDHFAHALANANSDIEILQDEIIKKNEENVKQQDEIIRLSYEMREIHRRLTELKKENEELKVLLSLTGKNRHAYETKIEDLQKNYSECLSKLQKSQQEINFLQKNFLQTSPSSPMSDMNTNRHTVFLSPTEYANFMSLENSLKSELEEVLEDPNQLCHSIITTNKKSSRSRRLKRGQSDTDGESSMNDSAFSDTESLSSASSCRFCQRSSPIPIDEIKSISSTNERRLPSGISSRLRLVKRLEGSNMLKRWQQLAEPSFSSCLQSIPGVYTRAEILHEVNEDNEDNFITPQNDSEERLSFSLERHSPEMPHYSDTTTRRMNLVELLTKEGLTARTLDSSESFSEFEKAFLTCSLPNRFLKSTTTTIPDPDEIDDEDDNEPTTPPSSPTHGAQLQTSALLHQAMQRLVKLSLQTFETLATSFTPSNDHNEGPQRLHPITTITPPSSPTFDGLVAPTPNTAMHAIKTSTFLRASSLNPFTNRSIRSAFSTISPGEKTSLVDDLIRGRLPRI
ncbi:unnamed protein product [Adineta steineri]|uniref:HAP1 N-terminal domain-containing protein n=1 Tax=Adineta steineri TaxID=433720 RepID=A0A815FTR7_9BILA|nr:unnamed protein product [Adineta steineri]CAF1336909.1 unnamed protein product [Adineta steineri]CAF3573495.1 unnamed protein product [Adineta steineri]CAF3628528.1 unnamed protein product [Adineta steineri]